MAIPSPSNRRAKVHRAGWTVRPFFSPIPFAHEGSPDMIRSSCGYRALAVLALFLAFLGLAGCGSAGGRVPVQGSVTYKGEPVDNGTISFVATEGGREAASAGGDIKDGKYSIDAERGPKPGK